MGRYYDGDISGKFWFGVQSSTDAEFFGVQGHTTHLSYFFQEDDKYNIKEGIFNCEKYLKGYKKKLDDFFDDRESYNNEMLMPILGVATEEDVTRILAWYARLQLGRQIYDCILEKGECDFEAEL